MKLEWKKTYDDKDREVWEAASIFHDEGSFFYYRVKQVHAVRKGLEQRDEIRWKLDSDAELLDRRLQFGTLEEGQQHCQRCAEWDEAATETKKEQRVEDSLVPHFSLNQYVLCQSCGAVWRIPPGTEEFDLSRFDCGCGHKSIIEVGAPSPQVVYMNVVDELLFLREARKKMEE